MAIPTATGMVLAPARKSTGQIHAVAADSGRDHNTGPSGENGAEHDAGEGEPLDLLTLHPPCSAEAHHQRDAPRHSDRERHEKPTNSSVPSSVATPLNAKGVGHAHKPEVSERSRLESQANETHDGYQIEPDDQSPATR